MIAVVQLDVFLTIIMPFRNNGKNLDCPLFPFWFGLGFLALELREKIPLPRAWVDEVTVLKSDAYPKNFITFYKSKVSEDCS